MLFDDYAARFARGERPDAREYLARAGEGVDELGTLIERFLERAAPPAPDDGALRLAEAWVAGNSPLVQLRAERGLRREEVVDSLIAALGLDRAKREKVTGYYHQLENGLLDVTRVDRRVWEVLAEALEARLGDLVAWRPRPIGAKLAYMRPSEILEAASPSMPAAAAAPRAAAEPYPDEVDRLFGQAP